MPSWVGLLAILVVLVACTPAASGSVPPSGDPASVPHSQVPARTVEELTAYDAASPNLREEANPDALEGGVTVHDVSWISPGGGRATAWLVVPPGSGPFAGIVYQHGSETDRDDFQDEAVAMAHAGAVSLVLDAPFARTGPDRHAFLANFGLPERERDMTAQAIVDIRRAYDLLGQRDDVDPDRLAFVGHSWGAPVGAVLAAVDERPRALVLITGRPSWTGFLSTSADAWVRNARTRVGEDAWAEYLRLMGPFDALAVIDDVDTGRLYLQYGTADDVVPESVARELVEAVPGARVSWYDAGHALNDAATAERVGWLVDHLALTDVPAEVLAEVGLPDE